MEPAVSVESKIYIYIFYIYVLCSQLTKYKYIIVKSGAW